MVLKWDHGRSVITFTTQMNITLKLVCKLEGFSQTRYLVFSISKSYYFNLYTFCKKKTTAFYSEVFFSPLDVLFYSSFLVLHCFWPVNQPKQMVLLCYLCLRLGKWCSQWNLDNERRNAFCIGASEAHTQNKTKRKKKKTGVLLFWAIQIYIYIYISGGLIPVHPG